ncbi:MAG: fibrobacter succinogenes major paralogous domain-containing protein [Bacteroidales bacterium]|nr:fibrobacter succinogenes major paralogous domain-containing protein [Bacteroidales bacterium]
MENCLKKLVGIMVAMVAILFAGCNDDENAQNNNGNYPPTANVIPNAVTDIDGNSYDAVRIGDQIWMASNLRTTHYADGEEIERDNTYVVVFGEYGEHRHIDSFCQRHFYVPSTDIASYGYLYDPHAALYIGSEESDEFISTDPYEGYWMIDPLLKRQGVCPDGWHLPTIEDWRKLEESCRVRSECTCNGFVNYIAKSLAANRGWHKSRIECAVGNDLSANNATGFSALPAGVASLGYDGFDRFDRFGEEACFITNYGGLGCEIRYDQNDWHYTYGYYNYYSEEDIMNGAPIMLSQYRYGGDEVLMCNGKSVRCIKD